MSDVGAPSPRSEPHRAWIGDRLVVVGGEPAGFPTTGGVYDPEQDRWTPIDQDLVPPRFAPNLVVWDGCRLLIAGIHVDEDDNWRPELWAYEPPSGS
jgi:hypothetical protein